MIVKLIKIGNSKGVRLPKKLIDKHHLDEDLELIDTENGLLLRQASTARIGWEEKFIVAEKDEQVDDDFSDLNSLKTDFDKDEWEW